MNPRPLLVCAVLSVALTPAARAQRPEVQNPHGHLDQPCAVCHSPEAWAPARISSAFDHGKTGFPLHGAHTTVACKSCHTVLTFKGVSQDCASCHKDPHHGELGTGCDRCHTARSFVDKTEMARAHQLTRFPLTGAHVAVDCEECHARRASGQMSFVARSTGCNDCHARDYLATRSPDHTAAGFPHQCEQCHVTVAWQTAKFDHSATAFPLTGAHLAVPCAQCHKTGFGALPTTCVSCHQADFNNTTDPNHQASGFPTDCASCHTTTTWTGATFDHNGTAFPLTGAHVSVACDQCHGDGVYKGKSTACVSCHQTDFNNTTDPAHQQLQFATDCTSCHTTTTWASGQYLVHDAQYFPIYSGRHAGRWNNDCATCHIVPTDYTQFDCIQCHQDAHSSKNYTNQQCYSCHPTGRSG